LISDDPLITNWVIVRYFSIGFYVGCATIGIFAYWYLYYEHIDGHSLVTWNQLTNWMECEKWTDFKVNDFMGIDLQTNPCNYFTTGKRKAVSLSLTVLVIIEMLNAMNAVSDESSIIIMHPFKNLWLILAIFFSVSLHCMILYIPFFNKIFGIAPLDLNEWILVMIFSVPVILIEELTKILVRAINNRNIKKVKTD
jgi:Ca2+-transporting ATPase